jgi:hypothetical protein
LFLFATCEYLCNFLKKFEMAVVALPEIFSAALSLLNLLEEGLGRSKPATNLMQAQ